MASVGPNNPTSGTDDNAVGTVTWADPGNIITSDDADATATIATGDAITHYLKALFDFSAIPADATSIDGIQADIERMYQIGTGSTHDESVKLIVGGVVVGDEKAIVGDWPTADAYATYGGAADLWGLAPSVAEVRAADFGVVLSAHITKGSVIPGNRVAYVDHIRITVTYTAAAVASQVIQCN